MHRSTYLCLAGAVLPLLGTGLPNARADTTRVDTTRVVYVRGGIPEGYTGPLGNRSITLTEFTRTKTIPYGFGNDNKHITMECKAAGNFVSVFETGCAGPGGRTLTITASGSTLTVTVPSQGTADLGPGPGIFTTLEPPQPTDGGDGEEPCTTDKDGNTIPFPTEMPRTTDENGNTIAIPEETTAPCPASGPCSSGPNSSGPSSSASSPAPSSPAPSSSAPSSSAPSSSAPSSSAPSSSTPSSSAPSSSAPSSSVPGSSSSIFPSIIPGPSGSDASSSVPSSSAPSSPVPSSSPSGSAPSSSAPSSESSISGSNSHLPHNSSSTFSSVPALSSTRVSSTPASSSAPSSSAPSSSAPSSSAPSSSVPSSSALSSSPVLTSIPVLTSSPVPSSSFSTPASSSASSTSSASPSPSCSGLVNGAFVDGVLSPWYLSDQVTSDSTVIAGGPPGGDGYAFEMIPSQSDYGRVYLNQLLPSCGNPPPEVTVHIKFQYMFSGTGNGCSIGAKINQDGATLFNILDTSATAGEWYTYEGPATTVQLSYNPLFTMMMECTTDTARTGSVQIAGISVY